MTITGEPTHHRPGIGRETEIELFSVAGHDGHLREVNDSFARLLGMDPSELNDRSLLELVHPADVAAIVAGLAALERGSAEVLFESRFRHHGEGWIHLQWVARPIAGTDLWWAAGRDTTAFHRLLAEGVDLRARLDLALGQATVAMWELDPKTGSLSWEPQAAEVLGVDLIDLPRTVAATAAVLHPDDGEALVAAFGQLLEVGTTDVSLRTGKGPATRYLSLRGTVLDRDHRGRVLRAVGLLLDVTSEKAMEEQMLRMVMSDALTGAPNRRAFDQALRSEWRRCARVGDPLSVVMIDIDNFKKFNDTFGHLVGDEVLCAVSRALASNLQREGDGVARFGGEEFSVVLPAVDSPGALRVANRLCEAVRQVTIRQAPGWSLSVSIGTATWRPDSGPLKPAQLLARADEALYVAKSAGKDRATTYEVSLAAGAELEEAIRSGLADGEFEMHYQPILDLVTESITGFEALMRWNRPGHGRVAPDAFIPVAERSALICDLGRFALRQATSQLASWLSEGLDPHGVLRIAVNVSGRHVGSPDLVDDVERALADSGLSPERLEVELTETALAVGDLVSANLAELRASGVSVSLDDFGTGHTSVGQLSDLPVDTLKIDRSFVAPADPRRRHLVPLIIGAAHAFDLRVVAEGIEDLDTLRAMRSLGCDDAQGYLIARPMPAESVPQLLGAGPDVARDWL